MYVLGTLLHLLEYENNKSYSTNMPLLLSGPLLIMR